ncbi:MAG TPA: PIN domain-containing protein [Bryobacteraceae bacterium]|jgi:predicted nucleic acid-binding protein|nr:PIN domain-containing protein [Bryobacteraceae bacterium]
MPRLLLDTSFLIDVLNDRRGRADLMEQFIVADYILACCAINVAEVYAGLRVEEVAKTEALLRQLVYVPIKWEAARLAGDLKRIWARKGKTLTLTDTTIAAVCLTEGFTLATDNRKHFPMPELSLYPLSSA